MVTPRYSKAVGTRQYGKISKTRAQFIAVSCTVVFFLRERKSISLINGCYVLTRTSHVLATIAQPRFSLPCVNCFKTLTFPQHATCPVPTNTNESQRKGCTLIKRGPRETGHGCFTAAAVPPVIAPHVRSDQLMSGTSVGSTPTPQSGRRHRQKRGPHTRSVHTPSVSARGGSVDPELVVGT